MGERLEQKTLETLEYPKILTRLAEHTSFAVSRRLALSLTPSTDVDEVRYRQRVTTEARKLLEVRSSVSIGGARDISEAVRRARLGGVLDPSELLSVHSTLVAGRTVRNTIAKLSNQLPLLAEMAGRLVDCPQLEREVARCLNDRAEVVDDASPLLRHIRSEIRVAHGRLLQRLNDLLSSPDYRHAIQEPIVTVREGRYVIPIKSEQKGQVRGVVHDQSASGATLFVEPLATVELNNRWRELQLDEEREVERILRSLSALVSASADVLDGNLAALGEIDLALAKARYSSAIGGVEPQLVGDRGSLSLINARHPLLGANVVPISVPLGGEYTVLVITGPNTGGKTVALKTVGLLTAMAQAGLHIPADEGSRVRIFESIYADIGDEQSIEQSLSTFSSHMTHIVSILREANERSLVLLDELGAGTDPAEGSALARAILGELLADRAWTVATTHYSELKAYAHITPGVENASVEFDLETLAPTYRLSVGLPGMSNALAIASRLGLADHIVEAARKLLNPDEVQVESLLAQIREERARAAADRARAEEIRADADKLRQRLAAQLRSIDEERQRLIAETRSELSAEIDELRRRLRRALLVAERPSTQVHDLMEAAREVKEIEKDLESRLPRPEPAAPESPDETTRELRPGDVVKVKSLNEIGEIVSLSDSRREAEVQLGSFKLKIAVSDLERSREGRPAERFVRSGGAKPRPDESRPTPSIDFEIRGWRADEVAPELDKYLDEAYLSGLPFVRVIHGKGTGVLRQVVREQLATHPLVRSFQSAPPNEGGEGVTVAVLNR